MIIDFPCFNLQPNIAHPVIAVIKTLYTNHEPLRKMVQSNLMTDPGLMPHRTVNNFQLFLSTEFLLMALQSKLIREVITSYVFI